MNQLKVVTVKPIIVAVGSMVEWFEHPGATVGRMAYVTKLNEDGTIDCKHGEGLKVVQPGQPTPDVSYVKAVKEG